MRDRRYSMYGIGFTSPWRLPYSAATDTDADDIQLVEASRNVFHPPMRNRADQPLDGWFHQQCLPDGSVYLRWNRHFEFLISPDGGRIAGRPFNRASQESFHAYLLGQVLSYVLLKRGFDPLHGSVVVVDGAAVAFLGDCGYGKSSLAASFIAAGHALLTDDLLVIRSNTAGFDVFPGPPRIKLWPRIARTVLSLRHGSRMNQSTPKLVIPLRAHEAHGLPAPLKAIYVLSRPTNNRRTSKVIIRQPSRRRCFIALLRNTFNALVREPDRLERQFRQASAIAACVPIKMLSYRRDIGLLPAVRRAVLTDIGA